MDIVKGLYTPPPEEVESNILAQKDDCCLVVVRASGEPLGISCQQVFERAYARIAHPQSFARAVFARYLSTAGKGPLPKPVAEYLVHVTQKGYEKREGKEGFCSGCMLTKNARTSFEGGYELVHPESLFLDVLPGSSVVDTEHTAVNKLYLDLLDSGALTEESETWQDELGSFEE